MSGLKSGYAHNSGTLTNRPDEPTNAPFSGFPGQARQQVDVPHGLDRLFCARAVPIVSIQLTGRRATAGSMHPAYAIAIYRSGDRQRKPVCFDLALQRGASWALCMGLMLISFWYLPPPPLDQAALSH